MSCDPLTSGFDIRGGVLCKPGSNMRAAVVGRIFGLDSDGVL